MNRARRAPALAATALVLALTASCGLFGKDTAELCGETTQVLEDYNKRINSLPAADAAGRNRQAKSLASRLNALAEEADGDLRTVLRDMAAAWNRIDFGSRDLNQFKPLVREHPGRLATACREG